MSTKSQLNKKIVKGDIDSLNCDDLQNLILYSSDFDDEKLTKVLESKPELVDLAKTQLKEVMTEEAFNLVFNDDDESSEISIIRMAGDYRRKQSFIVKRNKVLGIVGAAAPVVIGIVKLFYDAAKNTSGTIKDSGNEAVANEVPEGKYWNKEKDRWEVNGVPISYRVTYKTIDDGQEHERIFTDVDQAYDYYQRMLKGRGTYGATYEHLD